MALLQIVKIIFMVFHRVRLILKDQANLTIYIWHAYKAALHFKTSYLSRYSYTKKRNRLSNQFKFGISIKSQLT